jgi:asparagine synthase (glutamine-hydrolysing)
MVLRHRGPDAEGCWSDAHVALIHRRLSIIDLSAEANQPLTSLDQQVLISFNGEIYNFQEVRCELEKLGYAFQTRGDTEVVVNAYRHWGIDSIKRLRGMFAFALWDRQQERLLLVRDRLGKKPLYYHASSDGLLFGSEIKAILEHPAVTRDVDLDALDQYLTFQYVPSPLTMFAGIRKLPAAHALVCESGRVSLLRYWEPTVPSVPVVRSETEVAEEVLALLRESVRLRMISDVPVGAFLSGGLDSSLVVALMAEQTAGKVRTYSVGFAEDEFDELPYARQVAERFGTDHHEMRLTADVAKILPTLIWHYNEPFGDSSMVPTYYVARAASEHVKVVLSGDGGDELFAGYRKYAELARLQGYDHLPGWLLRPARAILPDSWLNRDRGWGQLVDALNIRLMRSEERNYHWSIFFTPAHKRRLYSPPMRWALGRDRPREHYFEVVRSVQAPAGLARVLLVDALTYLPDDLLVKMDVASMACSLEVRAPTARPPAGRVLRRATADAEGRSLRDQTHYEKRSPTGFPAAGDRISSKARLCDPAGRMVARYLWQGSCGKSARGPDGFARVLCAVRGATARRGATYRPGESRAEALASAPISTCGTVSSSSGSLDEPSARSSGHIRRAGGRGHGT